MSYEAVVPSPQNDAHAATEQGGTVQGRHLEAVLEDVGCLAFLYAGTSGRY